MSMFSHIYMIYMYISYIYFSLWMVQRTILVVQWNVRTYDERKVCPLNGKNPEWRQLTWSAWRVIRRSSVAMTMRTSRGIVQKECRLSLCLTMRLLGSSALRGLSSAGRLTIDSSLVSRDLGEKWQKDLCSCFMLLGGFTRNMFELAGLIFHCLL